jgi:gamma-glutamylcyclotransferase (GGCT)/AIG2-like uncharacterized protein YtfP
MIRPPLVFIYNNLKVSPLLPGDAPVPGFEVFTYERESYTYGTLWDIGVDAGYTRIGKGVVYGQLWKITDNSKIEELYHFTGIKSGLMEEVIVPVEINIDEIKTKIEALTFSLTSINKNYNIIDDGYWLIKRNQI